MSSFIRAEEDETRQYSELKLPWVTYTWSGFALNIGCYSPAEYDGTSYFTPLLSWVPQSGEYRLWDSWDPTTKGIADPPICSELKRTKVSGQWKWRQLKHPFELHFLHKDIEGTFQGILGWNPQTGEFRVWMIDYNGSTGELELSDPHGSTLQGQWNALKQPYELFVSKDGYIMGINRQTGDYRLWEYSFRDKDLLVNPYGNVITGKFKWAELRHPFKLLRIFDSLIAHNPETGHYRAWKFDIKTESFPGEILFERASGQWGEPGLKHPFRLYGHPDNLYIMAINPKTGQIIWWRLRGF